MERATAATFAPSRSTGLMLNYIFADLDDVGDTHAAAMRFHLFL